MKPFERPGHDRDLLRYSYTARLVRAAGAVCAGRATLDHDTFATIPLDISRMTWEAGNVAGERQDMSYAFTTAFYAPAYGPASSETAFTPGATIEQSLADWSKNVTDRFYAAATPHAFADVFFEGGLWKVLLDPGIPGMGAVRAAFSRPDFGGLRQDPSILETVEEWRHDILVRDDLPHIGSQDDLARFANTVLHIGQTDMRMGDDVDRLTALLARSLPEAEDIAFLSVIECNEAFGRMINPRHPERALRSYLAIDNKAQRVGLNYGAIMRIVEYAVSDAGKYVRRGCPALFMRTPYKGKDTAIFRVLNQTLLRMYRQTGALTDPALRTLALPE